MPSPLSSRLRAALAVANDRTLAATVAYYSIPDGSNGEGSPELATLQVCRTDRDLLLTGIGLAAMSATRQHPSEYQPAGVVLAALARCEAPGEGEPVPAADTWHEDVRAASVAIHGSPHGLDSVDLDDYRGMSASAAAEAIGHGEPPNDLATTSHELAARGGSL